MYAAYFGLKHEPFSIAPDPRYLFMSERHREALAHLLYGLSGGGGFVLLTGEIGTGKTTVCRLFLEQVPRTCNVAYIFNPKLTVTELLQSICDEFRLTLGQKHTPLTVKDYLDPLNEFLLQGHAARRNSVLIIDEAQNLSSEVLEQLRLLTNLETRERKLLQIILIGQPELRQMLARPELEQLAQRVIARYHLGRLAANETLQYIQHRLEVAGLNRPLPFDRKALQRIHELSRGVPRRINLLCDRAMLGAFARSRAIVDSAIVDKAAAEVFYRPRAAPPSPRPRTAAVLGFGLAVGAGLFAAVSQIADRPAPAPAAAVAAAPAMQQSLRPVQAASAAAQPASAPAPARGATDTVDKPGEAAGLADKAGTPAVSAETAPAAPPAPTPVLLRDASDAWRELAQNWKANAGEGDPCKALARQQLHCFSRSLSLPLIRELGRPGVLTLDANTGSPRYAILTGLTRDTATLRAAGTEQTVTLAALAARWQGDFATLWKAPPGYGAGLPDGRSETAGWVAARLATVNGSAPDVPEGLKVLDAKLKDQLRTFQLSRGLAADGLPGPMTLMQLNRVAGVDEPRLRTEH